MKRFEYRVWWEASSMQGFEGSSDWEDWDGPEQTADAVAEALTTGGEVSRGLGDAIEASGFGWSTEVREITS